MQAMNTMNTMIGHCRQAGNTVTSICQWLCNADMANVVSESNGVYWCEGLVGYELWAHVLGEAGVAGGTVSTVCDSQWSLVGNSDGVWLSKVSQCNLLVSKGVLWLSVCVGEWLGVCDGNLWLMGYMDGSWLNVVLLDWDDGFADDSGLVDWSLVDESFTFDNGVETVVCVSGVVNGTPVTIRFNE